MARKKKRATAKKTQPRPNPKAEKPVKKSTKKAAKRAQKKGPEKSGAPKRSVAKRQPAGKRPERLAPVRLVAAAVENCLSAAQAQQVVDRCMSTFGVGGVSRDTAIGQALPARVNAFCSCIRTNSGIPNARCNGSMTFQEVEIDLVCP